VVCDYGAIDVSTGVARIIEDKCTGCRMCVTACPTGVIGMKPLSQRVLILCASLEKGKATMAACDVGCIGCKKCVKVCPETAITVDNFLATINPVLCTSCGKCVESCPTNAIYEAGRSDGKSLLRVTPAADPVQAAQMRAELDPPNQRPVV
jgi:ferredoxin